MRSTCGARLRAPKQDRDGADPKSRGVASAKPTVTTGSEDARVNKNPPGKKKPQKDWDINYDPADRNESRMR
ncbi:hypothetical protein [Rhizobium laguerreae]|uniref:Uncharacterized protein n=1 Tax=Rhizobium laguerreae TaxID=1076926 RepID=A0A6N9ZE73_9HYPH|nr:hypothetical protein [Rhizobium laguerreae]